MSKNYLLEKDGQLDFFNHFGIGPDSDEGVKLINSTDGIYKGTIFEFKLNINNYNQVLIQAIKYLSHQRILGHSIPKNILLISLNKEEAYLFNSKDFLPQIEKLYVGPSSKNNDSWTNSIKPEKIIEINSRTKGLKRIEQIIDDESFTKINIDENCVIGWAERYYLENKKSTKRQFFAELRKPSWFREFINPWKGQELDFKYIMDCLNDPDLKKRTGAFYTPFEYCTKALDMVRRAISERPKGNSYIIIDRCAGTGNLEEQMNPDELSHTIVSTYELKEWEVLYKRIGNKVKTIIPPKPTHNKGIMTGGDALAQDVFDECRQYIEDKKCTVILLENPPFFDKRGIKDQWKTYVHSEMIKEVHDNSTIRDAMNQFIWSGWKFYLRKPHDSYILFSPIKYWKSLELCNKTFIEGYLTNREHYHAGASAIALIWWKNIEDPKTSKINLIPIDISAEYGLVNVKGVPSIPIRKVKETLNPFNDKRKFPDDTKDGIYCESGGYESKKTAKSKAVFNKNIIGHLKATSFNLDSNSWNLSRIIPITALEQHYGFYLRNDNFYNKLPLFAAKLFPEEKWYETNIYFTTADKGEAYTKDNDFIKSCLIYCCLIKQNNCISFRGSDNRDYINELTFTLSNGEDHPLTCADKYLIGKKLNAAENKIMLKWEEVLETINGCDNFNPEIVYGIYQIDKELNTRYKLDKRGNKIYKHKDPELFKELKRVKVNYDYPALNTHIDDLDTLMNEYYKKFILNKMKTFELIK